ncbi:MAG: hypothetical protein E7047_08580 [Lentisphaerae bacterium]|nr:hypothetical protein [Lentisphaerota bacterium]
MFESGKFEIGLNYWASKNATRMWREFDADSIEQDFAAFEKQGITLLRVFPLWPDFQPLQLMQYCGNVYGFRPREVALGSEETPLKLDTPAGKAGLDEVMLERFRTMADLAEKHHLKLIVAIMTIHMTGRHYAPPAMENRDVFSDPFALKWEMKFYDAFVRCFKDHPAIAAWETGNEMNLTAPVQSADHAWVWTNMMHNIIRLADPSRPVIAVGSGGFDALESKWLIADQAELSDFTNVHKYDIGNIVAADGFLHLRCVTHAVAESKVINDVGGKPCFIEETGNWRNTVLTLEDTGNAVNCIMWNAWRENCRSLLWWCAFDQSNMEFAPYHWGDWPGLEHGVFSADRQPHPAAEKMRSFRRMLDCLEFDRLPPVKSHAVCLVDNMNTATTAYTLARQAGVNLQFAASRAPLPEADFYFLPGVSGRGGLSSEDYRQLRERVCAGASCYISADDCNLPGLREFCGMQIKSRRQAVKNIEFDTPSGRVSLPAKVEKELLLEGAQVVIADASGRPVLLKNRFGQGTVYTMLFALENTVFDTPRALDMPCWEVYRAMLEPVLAAASPDKSVILTEHWFDKRHAVVVAVNCSDRSKNVPLTVAENLQVRMLAGDGSLSDSGILSLLPGGGAVLDVQNQ